MLRILAFDVGEKRIGVAVSDPLGYTAQGIETYHRTGDLEQDVSHLIKLANGYKPVKIVFGLPRNMDGSYGFQAQITREFADAVLAQWLASVEVQGAQFVQFVQLQEARGDSSEIRIQGASAEQKLSDADAALFR